MLERSADSIVIDHLVIVEWSLDHLSVLYIVSEVDRSQVCIVLWKDGKLLSLEQSSYG